MGEFLQLTADRLFEQFDEIAPIELFSTLYALVNPWRALPHEDVFELLQDRCVESGECGKVRLYRRGEGGRQG